MGQDSHNKHNKRAIRTWRAISYATTALKTVNGTWEIPAVVCATSMDEGDSGEKHLDFVVSLSSSPRREVRIRAASSSRIAGQDSVDLGSQVLVFDMKATGAALSKTVTMTVRGDEVDENDETFTLRLDRIVSRDDRVVFAGGGKSLETTGVVVDDDAPAEGARQGQELVPERLFPVD